jgi:dienelactone hydrolase
MRQAMTRYALLLAAALTLPCAAQEKVSFPSLDRWKSSERLVVEGYFYKPAGKERFAVVAMFHGCSGALERKGGISQRFRDMAGILTGMGHGVLLVDSFTPRGEREICTTPIRAREIHEEQRWLDAFGAIEYLGTRADVLPGKIAAIGFSHGGTNALQVMDAELPPKKEGRPGFVAAVSMYPGCTTTLKKSPQFRAYAPLLVLAGELDDWTPVAPCRALVERSRGRGEPVEIEVYPDAYHGFDQTTQVRVRTDVIRSGKPVHVGGNPAAREAAYKRIREFFARHLGS